MTYAAILDFFGKNPWIVAVCAIVTLWPVIRSTFKSYRRLERWIFHKIEPADHVAELSAKYPSYFASFLIKNAAIIYVLLVLFWICRSALHALPISDGLNGAMVARFFVGWLSVNAAILMGLIGGVVIRLCSDVVKLIEDERLK